MRSDVKIIMKDIESAKDAEFLKAGFCEDCFKDTIYLISADKSQAMCRKCGTVVYIRKEPENDRQD